MAELAGAPECPSIEIVVDHYAKSDTPSNSHHQKMMIGLTLTEELFVDRQTIDIIIKEDGDIEAVFQGMADLNVLPVQDPRIDAASMLGINQPTHAKAYTDDLFSGNATFGK